VGDKCEFCGRTSAHKRHPGKFESATCPEYAETLYGITLDGCCEESGDCDLFGQHMSLVEDDGRWFTVVCDTRGSVTFDAYESEDAARMAFAEFDDLFTAATEGGGEEC
jgi:hypothetical protein